jgi:hypothetical protein
MYSDNTYYLEVLPEIFLFPFENKNSFVKSISSTNIERKTKEGEEEEKNEKMK